MRNDHNNDNGDGDLTIRVATLVLNIERLNAMQVITLKFEIVNKYYSRHK